MGSVREQHSLAFGMCQLASRMRTSGSSRCSRSQLTDTSGGAAPEAMRAAAPARALCWRQKALCSWVPLRCVILRSETMLVQTKRSASTSI